MIKTKHIKFYTVYFLVVIIFFEFSLRAFFSVQNSDWKIMMTPASLKKVCYKEMGGLMNENINSDNDVIDILLLGGSVLHNEWGNIGNELNKQLSAKYPGKIKIHNVATPAHTSTDSRIKYKLLENQHFDIVLLYHGINEVRYNNCPDDVFKNDYSHVGFYNIIHSIVAPKTRFTIFPYTYTLLNEKLRQNYLKNNRLPIDSLNKDWLQFGENIKTAPVFQTNYNSIIEEAIDRNQPIIISTFANYVPQDYTLANFKSKKLDYGEFKSPIEIWGEPKNVIKGIESHNNIINQLSATYIQDENVHFVDMDNSLEKSGKYFDDICHFTNEGSAKFAEIILPTIIEIIEDKKLILTENKSKGIKSVF